MAYESFEQQNILFLFNILLLQFELIMLNNMTESIQIDVLNRMENQDMQLH